MLTILSIDQQVERIRMVWGLCCGLPATQGIPIATTSHVQSWGRWSLVCIYHCGTSCCELGTNTGWQWPSKSSILREQIITWGWGKILTLGESHTSYGPRYTKASPLFPSPHNDRFNLIALEVRTSDYWLHWKDRHMEHHSGSFGHQIHASDLHKGPGPSWLSGRICWTNSRNSSRGVKHGWKTSWGNLYARTPMLKGVRWWHNKSKGVRSGASSSVSWKDYYREIPETWVLGHE